MSVGLKEWTRALTLRELAAGMAVTLRYFFKPNITVQYPEERIPASPRFRGEHALRRHETGEERCVACKLCESACPAQAIFITIDPNSTAEKRRTQVYDIDDGKCIFCGYCQDACPVDAIVLGPNFEFFAETRDELVYDKQKLLGNYDRWKVQIDANLLADAPYR